jgi:hypothetical protein
MVLTAYFELSLVIGLIVTIAGGILIRRLDAGIEASGPHDFTVRNKRRSSARAVASNASRPASVTIAIRPSVGQDGDTNEVFRVRLGRRFIFCRGVDRKSLICPSG